MTSDDISEAATPGPWARDDGDGNRWVVAPDALDGARLDVCCGALDRDARVIALAGSVWPELLAVVEAARAAVVTAKPDPETWPARRKLCWMLDDLDVAIRRSLDGAR